MLKNKTLAISVPIDLSIKLGFVSVSCPEEAYFVDAPCVLRDIRTEFS